MSYWHKIIRSVQKFLPMQIDVRTYALVRFYKQKHLWFIS